MARWIGADWRKLALWKCSRCCINALQRADAAIKPLTTATGSHAYQRSPAVGQPAFPQVSQAMALRLGPELSNGCPSPPPHYLVRSVDNFSGGQILTEVGSRTRGHKVFRGRDDFSAGLLTEVFGILRGR